jgi:hypothetical protein
MLIAIASPAIIRAPNTSCSVNPIDMPIRICCSDTNSPSSDSASTSGKGGNNGTTSTESTRVMMIFARVGTSRVPITGIASSIVPIRIIGQIREPTNAVAWAKLKSIRRSPDETRNAEIQAPGKAQ